MKAPISERAVLVIIESDDPRDLKAILRAGISLRTKNDVVAGGELRVHVVAPQSLSDGAQLDESPVELRLNRDHVVKPTKED